MARKSIVQLQADLLSSFPDNVSGAITPLVLRTYLNNFLEAIRPAYAGLSRPGPTVQTIGTTWVPVVFDTGFVSDVPDYTVTAGTGAIARLAAGTTRLTVNGTLEAANGRLISFALYKNGVITAWRSSVSTLGAGKPVDFTISALNYDGSAATYQLQAIADVAGVAVTFSNTEVLAESVPVNTY